MFDVLIFWNPWSWLFILIDEDLIFFVGIKCCFSRLRDCWMCSSSARGQVTEVGGSLASLSRLPWRAPGLRVSPQRSAWDSVTTAREYSARWDLWRRTASSTRTTLRYYITVGFTKRTGRQIDRFTREMLRHINECVGCWVTLQYTDNSEIGFSNCV